MDHYKIIPLWFSFHMAIMSRCGKKTITKWLNHFCSPCGHKSEVVGVPCLIHNKSTSHAYDSNVSTKWLNQIIMYKMNISILPHQHKLFILYAMSCHNCCLIVLPILYFQLDCKKNWTHVHNEINFHFKNITYFSMNKIHEILCQMFEKYEISFISCKID